MLFAANFAVEQDVIAAAITTALLMLYLYASDQWRSQPRTLGVPKALGRAKMFGFRQITLFSFEKCLSKHKVTIFSKNFGGNGPFRPSLATPMLRMNNTTRSIKAEQRLL